MHGNDLLSLYLSDGMGLGMLIFIFLAIFIIVSLVISDLPVGFIVALVFLILIGCVTVAPDKEMAQTICNLEKPVVSANKEKEVRVKSGDYSSTSTGFQYYKGMELKDVSNTKHTYFILNDESVSLSDIADRIKAGNNTISYVTLKVDYDSIPGMYDTLKDSITKDFETIRFLVKVDGNSIYNRDKLSDKYKILHDYLVKSTSQTEEVKEKVEEKQPEIVTDKAYRTSLTEETLLANWGGSVKVTLTTGNVVDVKLTDKVLLVEDTTNFLRYKDGQVIEIHFTAAKEDTQQNITVENNINVTS